MAAMDRLGHCELEAELHYQCKLHQKAGLLTEKL